MVRLTVLSTAILALAGAGYASMQQQEALVVSGTETAPRTQATWKWEDCGKSLFSNLYLRQG
jgi:hypothetical protein